MNHILMLACGHTVATDYGVAKGVFFKCTTCNKLFHVTNTVSLVVREKENERE